MILNTVDCTRPNGGRLPQSVDLMMSDFAGGASGFPATFYGGKYSGEIFFFFSSSLVRSPLPAIRTGRFLHVNPLLLRVGLTTSLKA